jgi:hypothetical protein
LGGLTETEVSDAWPVSVLWDATDPCTGEKFRREAGEVVRFLVLTDFLLSDMELVEEFVALLVEELVLLDVD